MVNTPRPQPPSGSNYTSVLLVGVLTVVSALFVAAGVLGIHPVMQLLEKLALVF